MTDEARINQLYQVEGLHALVKKYFKNASDKEAALLMEFVLHGLSAYSLLSKKVIDGKIEFKDLMGSMLNFNTKPGGYDEDTELNEEDF
jgi:magnesium chelatase subunit I